MRFLVDAQLPPALAHWLVGQGHVAEHVIDCQLAEGDDRTIWRAAAEKAAVIVSKDEDFAILAGHFDSGPAVVWLRIGNSSRNELLT